jgi:hypothetical protein
MIRAEETDIANDTIGVAPVPAKVPKRYVHGQFEVEVIILLEREIIMVLSEEIIQKGREGK